MELRDIRLHDTKLAEAFGNNKVASLPEVVSFLSGIEDNFELFSHRLFGVITSSVHYIGYNQNCDPKIVVAHNLGPLADPIILEDVPSYGPFYLSSQQFLDLLDGKYGQVKVFNPEDVIIGGKISGKYDPERYFFTSSEIIDNPFFQATLGEDASNFAHRLEALYIWNYKEGHSYGEPLQKNPPVIDLDLDRDFAFDLKIDLPLHIRNSNRELGARAMFLCLGRYPTCGSMIKWTINGQANYSSVSISQVNPGRCSEYRAATWIPESSK